MIDPNRLQWHIQEALQARPNWSYEHAEQYARAKIERDDAISDMLKSLKAFPARNCSRRLKPNKMMSNRLSTSRLI